MTPSLVILLFLSISALTTQRILSALPVVAPPAFNSV